MYRKGNKDLAVISLYLGDYTKRFYLREISKLAKMPLKTTQNIIARLGEGGIIKFSLEGKNKYSSLNLNNIQTKSYLLQSEIYRTTLFAGKYPLFKPFLKEVDVQIPLIVFGSFAKFTATKDSDLDLLIISEKKVKLPFHLLPYKIHKIYLSENSFLKAVEANEAFAREVAENHVVLNNHSFLVNIMWSHYAK